MKAALSMRNITVTFNGNRLFDDFSLSVPGGGKTVILGKSGTGKSTLLQMALGYIIPDYGSIYVNDTHLTGSTVWDIRKQIAYVSQNVTLGNGTVRDFLSRVFSFKANLHIVPSHDEIMELFDYFELPSDIRDQENHLLSGGEKQRIALSTALLLKRPLLLLDEITSALDPVLKEKAIDRTIDCDDYTVVVVSHDRVWLDRDNVTVYDLKERQWIR